MKIKTSSPEFNDLFTLYRERRGRIQARLAEFACIPPEEYFYELVYCLLTPQSSAVNAAEAVAELQNVRFHQCDANPEEILRRRHAYIRFHSTKSRHLVAMKKNFAPILEQLTSGQPGPVLREWLVRNVKGMGWKEASHLLRNIGHRDLAILDRHILRNLVRLRAIRGLPKTLTPRRYKLLERKFHTFAREIGIPMDELDLLFWSMETGEILK